MKGTLTREGNDDIGLWFRGGDNDIVSGISHYTQYHHKKWRHDVSVEPLNVLVRESLKSMKEWNTLRTRFV